MTCGGTEVIQEAGIFHLRPAAHAADPTPGSGCEPRRLTSEDLALPLLPGRTCAVAAGPAGRPRPTNISTPATASAMITIFIFATPSDRCASTMANSAEAILKRP